MHWRRKWQPTPVFLPGESQGWGAWWAAVYGVAQGRTRLKWLSSSSMRERKEIEEKSLCLICGLFLPPLFSTPHFPLVLQISPENVNLLYFTWMWERHWPCYAEWRRNPHSACLGRATFKELRKLEWSLCWEFWRMWDLPSFHAYQWACCSPMNAGKSHEIPWNETKDDFTHSNNINICTTSLSPNSYNTERARTTWTLSKLH